jgi:hypothetical protein
MLLVSKKKTKSHGFINYYRNTTCSILLKQPDKHDQSRSKSPTKSVTCARDNKGLLAMDKYSPGRWRRVT